MRLTIAAVVLATALPLAAHPAPVEQGRALLDRGQLQEAADVLEKAVAATPSSAEAHFLLGSAYGELAERAHLFNQMALASKARAEFEAAVALDPNHLEARFALVEYYTLAPGIVGGSEEKAAAEANEIKKRDALLGHRAWAFIHGRKKRTDLARNEYLDAVGEQPQSPKAHIALATFYFSERNFDGAMTEVETAERLDPNYMPAWFWTGRLAVATGMNYARGEEALRKYLAHTPKHDEPGLHRAHYWLGLIYEKTGRTAEARASYEASLRIDPNQQDVTAALKRIL